MSALPATVTTEELPESRPEQAPRSAPRQPRILVTGFNELRVMRVARCLQGLRARVEKPTWEQALETLGDRVAALVLVDPLPDLTADEAVRKVREHPDGSELPTYVVVDDDTSSRRILKLYASGASAVFEWPREAGVLAAVFAESFGIVRVRGPSEEPDQALLRNVRAHLRLFPELPARVRLFVQDGRVSVGGQVPSLARRRELIETIAAVPGVRGVISRSLWVAAVGIPDAELARRLESLLEFVLEDASDLSLRVRTGRVTVSGKVRDGAEAKLLERAIADVRGVRALDLEIEVDGETPAGARQLARRLRRALALLYPGNEIRVEVVDGTAILSGTVTSLLTRYSIERFVARTEGVRHVVDKIAVE